MSTLFYAGIGAISLGAWQISKLFRELPLDSVENRRNVAKSIPGGEIPKGVRHEQEYFTTPSGVRLFTQKYFPKGKAKAVIFQCHGFGDNSNWLHRLHALRFVKEGFIVISLDLPSHGNSDGLFMYIEDFSVFVSNVHSYFHSAKQSLDPSLKCFLLGESLGGAVCLRLLQMFGVHEFDGAILMAPMCKISDNMKPADIVIDILSWVSSYFPTLPLIPTKDVINEAFRSEEKRILVKSNPHSPFNNNQMLPRLRTGLQMLAATEHLAHTMEEIKTPLLVLHGLGDTVTDPKISEELVERASSTDKTLKLYPDLWHCLFSEPEDQAEMVWTDVFNWISVRI